MNSLQDTLASQPRKRIPFDLSVYEPAISDAIQYLNSTEAYASIEACPYWPKWNSPWWVMSTLFEMGMAHRIPKATAIRLLETAKNTQLPYFFSKDAPPDKLPIQEAPCPCSLGNFYQFITATGLDVDAELPWARAWFLRYQMSDGGLNCDEDAYLADPGASSLVGTISPLEAILCKPEKITSAEEGFLDRGAKCLVDRELRLGSSSQHNAEERLDEDDWLKPCFPRLYFYDVLRGLSFILRWSEVLNRKLPASSIIQVVDHFCARFPDGKIKTERFSYEDVGTKLLDLSGVWVRGQPATSFSLLIKLSKINRDSPFLTSQWQEAIRAIDRLIERGLIT